jgi:hypothetical protein
MSGTDSLVSLVEHSVEGQSAEEIVNRLRGGLCELISAGEVELPARVLEPCGDHYARRLLHRDDAKGFSIVAMTQQFELIEQQHERFRFEKRGSFQAGIGSAGCLIPPHEYHTIRNASATPAVSVHIYGGDMSFCNVFEPANDGWFVRREKSLNLDF